MKLIAIIVLLVSATVFGAATFPVVKAAELNGVWLPTKQEMGGNAFPATLFEKQKLTITDTLYTLVAESVDKGALKYADGKMDIYGREGINKGRHFNAIYKLENGELTICYNLAGNGYPEVFDTKGKPKFFMSVFKKE